MNKDSVALLKFAIAVIIVAALLLIWFMTIGAPAGDEEEAEAAVAILANSIPAKFAALIPVL